MNKSFLIGRLTKDVDFNQENLRANFSIAVNGYGDHVDYINIVAWKKTAEIASKYLKKGDRVAIVGSISTRKYDASDGTKRTITEVVASELEFLESKKAETPREKMEQAGLNLQSESDEDLPF